MTPKKQKLPRHGKCKCGFEGVLYYFKKKYICNDCLNPPFEDSIENYVYRSLDDGHYPESAASKIEYKPNRKSRKAKEK